MRLFVAVEISDAMRQVVARAAESLRRTLARVVDARWVEPEQMHLTVRFIGHVDDDRVPDLLKILSGPLQVDPFEVVLGGCGAFPPAGCLRVIWIGLTAGLPSLTALHDEYDRRLAPLGFAAETRPYSAHLTLARVKTMRQGRPAALRDTIQHVTVEPTRCRIECATVFRSHTSSQGARYEPLAHAALSHAHGRGLHGTHGEIY